MNKGSLIKKLAEKRGLTISDTAKIVNDFCDIIVKSLKRGEDINITGFGKFYISERKERQGRNPKTGEKITIKPSRLPVFKAGKTLKSFMNDVS